MESIVKGAGNAPHRSLYHALGMTAEEMDKPMIGIVSSYNEIVPGHMNLDKIVEAVRMGVAMAGGNPVVFPAIGKIYFAHSTPQNHKSLPPNGCLSGG